MSYSVMIEKVYGYFNQSAYHLSLHLAMIRLRFPYYYLNQLPRMVNTPQVNKQDSKAWYVYIVRCRDNSCYTGITTDIQRRLIEHNSRGNGAKYTRARQPVTLIYHEQASSRSAAAKREYHIKKMSHSAKERLAGSNKISKQ